MNADSTEVAGRDDSSDHRSNPWWAWGCGAALTPSDRARYGRFNRLLLGWAVLYVGAAWLLKRHGDELGAARYLVAAVPPVVFLFGVASYARFLGAADELTRKIHLQGMAIGFGVGVVCMLTYPLVELIGAPEIDFTTASIMPTILGYSFGVLWTQRRYR